MIRPERKWYVRRVELWRPGPGCWLADGPQASAAFSSDLAPQEIADNVLRNWASDATADSRFRVTIWDAPSGAPEGDPVAASETEGSS